MAVDLRVQLQRIIVHSDMFLNSAQSLNGLPFTVKDSELVSDSLDNLTDSLAIYKELLERHRSSLRLVNRLPHDVLVRIFELCGPLASFHQKIRTPTHALAFSQVCRHWRFIALDAPSLWVTPIFDWPSSEVPRVMMERAQDAPLYIDTFLTQTTHEILLDVVMNKSLRYLKLFGDHSFLSELFMAALYPAHDVESLDIRTATGGLLDLPMTLFAGHAPRLRSVSLVNAMLPPRSPLYSTITALTLTISDNCAQLKTPKVLGVLKCVPMLTRAFFANVFDITSTLNYAASFSPDEVICLRTLQHLRVMDDLRNITFFLNCITYPSTATVIATGENHASSFHVSETFFLQFGSSPYLTQSPHMRKFTIESDLNQGTVVVYMKHVSEGEPNVTLTFVIYPTEEGLWIPAMRIIFNLVTDYLPLEDLETLDWVYDNHHGLRREDAERMLQKTHKLRALSTSGGAGYHAIAALLCLSMSREHVHLPSLSKISFHGINLLAPQSHLADAKFKLTFVETLAIFLDQRIFLGHAIEFLELKDCSKNDSLDDCNQSQSVSVEFIERKLRGKAGEIAIHKNGRIISIL